MRRTVAEVRCPPVHFPHFSMIGLATLVQPSGSYDSAAYGGTKVTLNEGGFQEQNRSRIGCVVA
jgi:hypothetical protein